MPEQKGKRKILIITGEVSADLIGASLITELNLLDENLETYGIGGEKMKAAGMNLLFHIDQMAFLGFAEVVKHLPFIKKVRGELISFVRSKNIKQVVLIDYPGFNINIAKKLKDLGIKIIYYVSPQLWAWRAGRLKKIKKLVDKMLVVFPFEKELYKKNGIDVEFVGHPLVERVRAYKVISKEALCSKFNLPEEKEFLLLMPGSRKQEVVKILPETFKAANRLADELNLQPVIAGSENIPDNLYSELTGNNALPVIRGHNYDLMKHSKFGIVKSGTSTLEAGYFGLPMIVVYKTGLISYTIGKWLIKIDKIGMVNILLGEKVVPELIQGELTEQLIYEKSEKILGDNEKLNLMKEKLSSIKTLLGDDGASEKAANIIYSLVNES